MAERHDVWKLADAIQMDLRAAQGKLVELRSRLAAMNLPEASTLRCPHPGCGLPMKGPRTLAEHIYTSHAGPLPTHWLRTDELAVDASEPGPNERTDSSVRDRSSSPLELERVDVDLARCQAPPPRQGGSAK